MPKSINRIAANEANTGFREAMLNTHTTVPDTQHIERKDAECQQEREHSLVYLCVHSSSLKILIGQILKELKLFTESKSNDTRKPKALLLLHLSATSKPKTAGI